eukprot:scaffold20371_cov102-Isochrysis_galbana.AAC.1
MPPPPPRRRRCDGSLLHRLDPTPHLSPDGTRSTHREVLQRRLTASRSTRGGGHLAATHPGVGDRLLPLVALEPTLQLLAPVSAQGLRGKNEKWPLITIAQGGADGLNCLAQPHLIRQQHATPVPKAKQHSFFLEGEEHRAESGRECRLKERLALLGCAPCRNVPQRGLRHHAAPHAKPNAPSPAARLEHGLKIRVGGQRADELARAALDLQRSVSAESAAASVGVGWGTGVRREADVSIL